MAPRYDIVVVGGGHAGCEAALAAARMGARALLVTASLDTLGAMSCNPAVGGLGKTHLVREVDALGGEIGRNADATGLQFRTLNTRKGPAVRAARVQCDRHAYSRRMRRVLESTPGITLRQGMVEDLLVDDNVFRGVRTRTGIEFRADAGVVTTGTFLRGLLHCGEARSPGGRAGDVAADGLSAALEGIGLELGRLKTGTPPRVLRRDLDLTRMQRQPGEEPPPFLSMTTDGAWMAAEGAGTGRDGVFHVEQIPCWLTRTTTETAEIIRANLHRSPLYEGRIEGTGPRYCPSIEDKVVRFPHHETHLIFVEPEGKTTDEVYLNGLPTSLPEDVQERMVRSVIGMERAVVVRPGYAVEYDYVFPEQLRRTLETRATAGLFLAGQINGTSGYEEAAAQGLLAAINAVFRVRGEDAISFSRSEAYIGVLVDDLVTREHREPYRMFTSRAEYRLLLRQDNADLRLRHHARRLGLRPATELDALDRLADEIDRVKERLRSSRSGGATLEELLRRPGVRWEDLPIRDRVSARAREQIEIDARYAGYLAREHDRIRRQEGQDQVRIPRDFDFAAIRGLRAETAEKWVRFRPESVGQAARIPGATPSDISLLLVWLRRGRRAAPTSTTD